MKVTFWGTRGSIPTPGKYTVKYGGNTPCVEVRSDDGRLLIIDAGTGICELGTQLAKSGEAIDTHILISHTHWDHIHGFPFFAPAFMPNNRFTICGPVNFDEKLETIMSRQMEYAYFPVKLADMHSHRQFVELKEGTFNVDDCFEVKAQYVNHPILTLAYRITCDGKTLVYCSDHEPFFNQFSSGNSGDVLDEQEEGLDEYIKQMNNRVINLCKDANLIIYDSQYLDDEYQTHRGWGHSTFNDACRGAISSGGERLAFFHHDPARKDANLEEIVNNIIAEYKKNHKDLPDFFAAQEELSIKL